MSYDIAENIFYIEQWFSKSNSVSFMNNFSEFTDYRAFRESPSILLSLFRGTDSLNDQLRGSKAQTE